MSGIICEAKGCDQTAIWHNLCRIHGRMTPPLPDLEEARRLVARGHPHPCNLDRCATCENVDQVVAFAARVRQDERDRCAKAVCYGCRIGHPFEDEARTFHHAGPRHGLGPKDAEEGCGWCHSIAIRLLDGGKEGK